MRELNETMSRLGALVRFHRHKAGLTQIQLAELAGVGKATVYDIEKGKTTVQMDKLFPVLAVLNVDIDFSGPLDAAFEEWYGPHEGDVQRTVHSDD